MRLKFSAVEGGFEDVGCLLCAVYGKDPAGAEHYLGFSRELEDGDPSEDWGIHCEFDDQANGEYNRVQRCRLTRTAIEVDLSEPIDWHKKYTGISVSLSDLDEATFAAIRNGLPRIFRGTEGVLQVA